MNTNECSLCHTPVTFTGCWPSCGCDPNLMLTVTQAARYLCMSRSGIYQMINDGYLAADRTHRPLRIRMLAIQMQLAWGHTYWLARQSREGARP